MGITKLGWGRSGGGGHNPFIQRKNKFGGNIIKILNIYIFVKLDGGVDDAVI